MAGIPYPNADLPRQALRCLVIAAALLPGAAPVAARPPLEDRPVVWHEDDRRTIPEPAERDPNLLWDGVNETFGRPVARLTHPGRFLRRVGVLFGGDHVPPAVNVNTLDEVPNSSWFTNRVGFGGWTPADVARGPAGGDGSAPSPPWTVISAKTEGVTPGFNIRDARGDLYLIKFDPPGFPGMTGGANAITGRLLHAIGYNVPLDDVVRFRRADVKVGDGVRIRLADGTKRTMTEEDLDGILSRVDPLKDGRYLAISSRFLAGTPLGPFDYKGRRKDDPNDAVPHEDRRELRGLRMFCAWLDHFDMKQGNTLDMYVEENGASFVKHHLIDFASTLGAGASGPWPQYNHEYSVDFPAIGGRLLSLGLHEDAWRRKERPAGLDEVGYFSADLFDPIEWKPLNPNSAFANLTDRDGYWAAKIIAAFDDDLLAAAAETGQYENPAAAGYIARVLGERRDIIARWWFDRVTPLDHFTFADGRLAFHDLGAEKGLYPDSTPVYRVRLKAAARDRDAAAASGWITLAATLVDTNAPPLREVAAEAPASDAPFLGFELQVDRGNGFGAPVTAWVTRTSGRVVAVDR